MASERVDTWVWLFVYAGMIVAGIRLAVSRGDAVPGWGIVGFGALPFAIGALLIWLRSRIEPLP